MLLFFILLGSYQAALFFSWWMIDDSLYTLKIVAPPLLVSRSDTRDAIIIVRRMDELHSQYPALTQQLVSQTFHKHQLHTI